jgi:hypothetical protein
MHCISGSALTGTHLEQQIAAEFQRTTKWNDLLWSNGFVQQLEHYRFQRKRALTALFHVQSAVVGAVVAAVVAVTKFSSQIAHVGLLSALCVRSHPHLSSIVEKTTSCDSRRYI